MVIANPSQEEKSIVGKRIHTYSQIVFIYIEILSPRLSLFQSTTTQHLKFSFKNHTNLDLAGSVALDFK